MAFNVTVILSNSVTLVKEAISKLSFLDGSVSLLIVSMLFTLAASVAANRSAPEALMLVKALKVLVIEPLANVGLFRCVEKSVVRGLQPKNASLLQADKP